MTMTIILLLSCSGIGFFIGFFILLMTISMLSDRNPKLYAKIVCFFNRKLMPIMLIDCTGDISYSTTTVKPDDNNIRYSYLFMDTKTGRLILNNDGKVDYASECFFVKFWLPIRENELSFHLLTNNIPDFDKILSETSILTRYELINEEYLKE